MADAQIVCTGDKFVAQVTMQAEYSPPGPACQNGHHQHALEPVGDVVRGPAACNPSQKTHFWASDSRSDTLQKP